MIRITYRYPHKERVTITVPKSIICVNHEFKIVFDGNDPGIKDLATLEKNIHFMMVEKGFITDNAEILSMEILLD